MNSGVTDSSRHTDQESERENVKLMYMHSSDHERDKSSGLSSDDETSSSIIPIPDTLRQVGCEFNRNISSTTKEPEIENYDYPRGAVENIPSSIEELRKKYSLKNDTSVTMKMNSANLMLDDILKSNNFMKPLQDDYEPKFFRDQDFRGKRVEETETSSIESVSTVKHCGYQDIPSRIPHYLPTIPYEIGQPMFCPKHHNSYQAHCECHNTVYKGMHGTNLNTCNKKKTSLMEKLQKIQLKYRIQSVYKMMQKSNPFSKESKTNPDPHSYTSGANNADTNVVIREFGKRKCDDVACSRSPYPKRMVFDLVESSDTSQFNDTCSEKNERNGLCSGNMNCTCMNRNECTCPEMIPRCICVRQTCNISEFTSDCESPEKHEPSSPEKVNELVQTESPIPIPQPNPVVGEKRVSIAEPPLTNKKPPENLNIKDNLKEEIKNIKTQKKHSCKESKLIERTDIYYFDHGNSAYYQTTDNHPTRFTECLVERTDEYATKFWGEVFGVLEVGVAFVISFILQLYRFFFTSIIRSLTVGLIQIFSDYFFKPLLTIFFNGLIQPCLILAYNIATSLRDLSQPISQVFGFFAKEVANIFRACRLVDINRGNNRLASCHCGNKV